MESNSVCNCVNAKMLVHLKCSFNCDLIIQLSDYRLSDYRLSNYMIGSLLVDMVF